MSNTSLKNIYDPEASSDIIFFKNKVSSINNISSVLITLKDRPYTCYIQKTRFVDRKVRSRILGRVSRVKEIHIYKCITKLYLTIKMSVEVYKILM